MTKRTDKKKAYDKAYFKKRLREDPEFRARSNARKRAYDARVKADPELLKRSLELKRARDYLGLRVDGRDAAIRRCGSFGVPEVSAVLTLFHRLLEGQSCAVIIRSPDLNRVFQKFTRMRQSMDKVRNAKIATPEAAE